MIQTGKNYVYGTAARKLEYDVYEENRVLKEKKKARSNNKTRLKAVCSILFVFACCLLIMYRYAVITELGYSVNKLDRVYNELKNENSHLRLALERDTDLDNIKKVAEERLGMQKPDRYQIVYINVSRSDFTSLAEGYKSSGGGNENMLAALMEKVGRFIRLLY